MHKSPSALIYWSRLFYDGIITNEEFSVSQGHQSYTS